MDLTERQEKILNVLIKEYIDNAEPLSSNFLREKCSLHISPATVRNDLQALTAFGYITQPHISAGRVPTPKAYEYFADKLFAEDENQFPNFITKEIELAKQNIDTELALAEELTRSLTEISVTLNYTKLENKDSILEILEILGPSRATHKDNIDSIKELLKIWMKK